MSSALLDEIDLVQKTNRQLRAQLAELTGAHLVSDLIAAFALTRDQARILAVLLNRRGCVVFKPAIHQIVWADDPDGGPDSRVVDVQICKVRSRLKPLGVQISTVWGQWYRLERDGAVKLDAVLARMGTVSQ